MALLRDEVVTELYDEETNYFDLSNEIRAKARKMAAERLLSQEPTWFVQFQTSGLSLMDDSEKSESVVKTFARDLISHRVTTIWQNQKATTKRKARVGVEMLRDSEPKKLEIVTDAKERSSGAVFHVSLRN